MCWAGVEGHMEAREPVWEGGLRETAGTALMSPNRTEKKRASVFAAMPLRLSPSPMEGERLWDENACLF